jgi:hypothetical protein
MTKSYVYNKEGCHAPEATVSNNAGQLFGMADEEDAFCQENHAKNYANDYQPCGLMCLAPLVDTLN